MINNLLTALAWGFSCGIVGVVYANILSREPLFNKWWRWGNKFETSHPNAFKLLFVCSHCFAGQFSFWSFYLLFLCTKWEEDWVTKLWNEGRVLALIKWHFYGLFFLIVAISAAIFTAKVITFFYKKNGIE